MPCKGRQAEGEFQSSSLFFAFHASALEPQFDARMWMLRRARAPRWRLPGGPGRSPGVFCTLCHETKCGPRPRPERASLRTQCANGVGAGPRPAVIPFLGAGAHTYPRGLFIIPFIYQTVKQIPAFARLSGASSHPALVPAPAICYNKWKRKGEGICICGWRWI